MRKNATHWVVSLAITMITGGFCSPISADPVVLPSARTGATPLGEMVTVRPPAEVMTRQGLPNFVGISQATAGATGISMNLVHIPAGGTAKPHYHRNYESAIYLLQGRVETRYGEGLCQSVVNQAGDFIYIPPNVAHQPRNLSDREPALAIVARNDPNEQESVVPYEADPALCGR